MSDARPDTPTDLVRLASDLLDAEPAAPVFISIDGRTVAPTLVRRAVRTLLEARLAGAPEGQAVRVELSEVTEHILAWGSIVLSEALAADLLLALAADGAVQVARREPRAMWVRSASPAAPAAPPAADGGA